MACKTSLGGMKRISSIHFFLIFAILLFAQLMLFHWQCFHSIIISSLWKSPGDFLLFYLPKLGVVVLLASFVFLFKNRWWTVIASLLTGLWELSELVYIRANHVPLDAWSVTMVDNMEGFWDSVPLYIESLDRILFLFPLILTFFVIIGTKDRRRPLAFFLCLSVGLICNVSACVWKWNKVEKEHCQYLQETLSYDEVLPPGAGGHHFDFFCSPLSIKMERQVYGGSEKYLYDYSAIHAFAYVCKCLIIKQESENILSSLSSDLFDVESEATYPDTRLVICLVESLESWALRPDVMPNLWRLKESGNACYCSSVVSQARRGTSADGQMIVETGLLPINDGAVCFRYCDNTFPSLSKLYRPGESCALFPHSLDVWNQCKMSPAYGISIEDNYTCSDVDTELFSRACELARDYESVLFITGSTHSPFKKVCDKSSLSLPDDMPVYMRDYLKSCNYFDESIGFFVDAVMHDESFKNTTVVITGDHTCFQNEKRVQFKNYCETNSMDYDVMKDRCPLIIVSPKIQDNIQIPYDCDIYQMDIFPTILNLLGCESYCWKGFGINILDRAKLNDRTYSDSEAFDLSEKIITTDFFSKFCNQLNSGFEPVLQYD